AGMIPTVCRNVTTVADIRALPKAGNPWAYAAGYYSPGDGGGGFYFFDGDDVSSPDDGGSVIVASDGGRWKLNHNNQAVDVRQFGALLDGVTDDSGVFQVALDFAAPKAISVTFNGTAKIDATLILHSGNTLTGGVGAVWTDEPKSTLISGVIGGAATVLLNGRSSYVRG